MWDETKRRHKVYMVLVLWAYLLLLSAIISSSQATASSRHSEGSRANLMPVSSSGKWRRRPSKSYRTHRITELNTTCHESNYQPTSIYGFQHCTRSILWFGWYLVEKSLPNTNQYALKKNTPQTQESPREWRHSPVHLLSPARHSESAPAAGLWTDCRNPQTLSPESTNTYVICNIHTLSHKHTLYSKKETFLFWIK